jgi:hypothetical protein
VALAHSLFGLAALQAGSQLPIATGSIAVGWEDVMAKVQAEPERDHGDDPR